MIKSYIILSQLSDHLPCLCNLMSCAVVPPPIVDETETMTIKEMYIQIE